MTLPTEGHWCIRSGGNDDNGAGYKYVDGDSIDYTNQDAAQEDWTNLTTSGAASTTLTDGDAGGKFTAAMKGSYIYIASGTNFTAGYYHITARADGDNVTLDRSPTPGAAGADGVGAVGGARATLTDAFTELVQVGDIIYMENGTYGLTGSVNMSKYGTALLPIIIEGFNTSYGDAPTGANRPLISSAQNIFYGNYWHMKHVRVTSSNATYTIYARGYNHFYNCDIANTAGSGNPVALNLIGNCYAVDCLVQSTRYRALSTGANNQIKRCFIKDSPTGIYIVAANGSIVESIIHNCTAGIDLTSMYNWSIEYCTIDGNTDGIYGAAAYNNWIYNNQFTNNVDGVHVTSEFKSNYLDYNNYFNNSGNDVTNVTKGPNATANNPGYTDQGADDFSGVDSADGLGMRLGVG